MGDEDCSMLVKCFFEEMFLKEIDDNPEAKRLSIQEDLTLPQTDDNFLNNWLLFSFD